MDHARTARWRDSRPEHIIQHIASSDPLASPSINPNFLSKDFDTQVLLDVLKFLQKLGQSAPFSNLVAVQTSPDPTSQTDEDLVS